MKITSATVGVAAAILLLIYFAPTATYQDEQMLLQSSGQSKALLTIGDRKIDLTEKDNEISWADYAASLMENKMTNESPTMIRVEVPRGGEYKLRLSDGTQVWLNAETVIEYPAQFIGGTRSIRVSGEAYFDVFHDSQTPFKISTGEHLEVTVLGTKFNVNSYAEQNDIIVTLVEGSVKVANQHKQQAILFPNEQAIYNKNQNALRVVDDFDMRSNTAWVHGQFYYHGAPIETILSALEKWYDIHIDYRGIDLSAVGATTLIFNRKDTLQSVLESLKTIMNIDYKIANNTIILTN